MSHHLEWIPDWEGLARKARHKAADMARISHCSLRQLERFFHEERDCCPHEWLIGTRLRHAVELFEQHKTNKEVAPVVGLKSASNLCHFFRQTTGMSPSRYVEHLHRFKLNGKIFASSEPPLLLNTRLASWGADI